MQIVESVMQYDWWPYRSADSGELSSLWLPALPENEFELLAGLAKAWSGLEWLVMGTWHRRDRELPAQGFLDRYPGLAREVIAHGDSVSPRGLASHSEWCIADSGSNHLHEMLAVIRKSRGKGACLALGLPPVSTRTWYAISMASAWRGSLALEFEGSRGLEDAHGAIIAQQLLSTSEAELVTMVPLDYHPMGGYVLLGGIRQLSAMADMLPSELPGLSDSLPEELFADGGGPAL
jgi:hypothetical protein